MIFKTAKKQPKICEKNAKILTINQLKMKNICN